MNSGKVFVLLFLVLCAIALGFVSSYRVIQYSPLQYQDDGVTAVAQSTEERRRNEVASEGWWTSWVSATSRIYPPWNASSYGWCVPTQRKVPVVPPKKSLPVHGLLYIKSYKASSSTCAGINMAIAHHVAERIVPLAKQGGKSGTVCKHYDQHHFHKRKLYAKRRVQGKSLLWTFVRNPVSRELSQLYHFMVTRHGLNPKKDVGYLLQSLKNNKGQQVKFLSLQYDDVKVNNNTKNSNELVSIALRERIFEQYDFIGIVERMAESLAVMTILWDLDPTDVIVLSAKQSKNGDNYDDGQFKNTCFKMIPAPKKLSDLEPYMAQYLQSDEYIEHNPDFLLYYAADESLDRTIDALGRDKVKERTEVITKLQSLADEKCQKEAIFPCSNQGVLQTGLARKNCYSTDSGCGYPCVDRLMSDYRSGQIQLL